MAEPNNSERLELFNNRYGPIAGKGGWGGGWGISVILVRHNFEHNTLLSQVTPESIIIYFTSIIGQTLVNAGKDTRGEMLQVSFFDI